MNQDVERLIRKLELPAWPHPEGGWFRETYRAPSRSVAEPGDGARNGSTAIYFLLPAGEFSAFHLLRESDEMWHHYAGDPGSSCTRSLRAGSFASRSLVRGIEHAERPQVLVPAGTLQAALVRGTRFALCGCTVTPAFDFADFEMPARDELLVRYPQHAEIIGRPDSRPVIAVSGFVSVTSAPAPAA